MVFVRVRKRPGIHQFFDASDEIPQFLTSPDKSAVYIFLSIGKPIASAANPNESRVAETHVLTGTNNRLAPPIAEQHHCQRDSGGNRSKGRPECRPHKPE
jgi:hypothetical protein